MPEIVTHNEPILIVDDERANVLLLKKIFAKRGFRHIVTTTDPTETATLYRQHSPGVILLDISMPQMDGFEVMAQLQAQEGDALAPIVILSAQGDQEVRVRALQEGARDYVGKPFNQVELLTRVENMLALQVAERQRLHIAHHFDSVTELPNRDYSLTLLSGLLESSTTETSRMALAVLEVASYQRLVQSFGYAVADACLLTWAARAGDPVDWIAPYRLQTPVAPAQAAALEKQLIDPTVLEDRLGKLAAGKDIVLVEGAGGLMVPVRGGFLIADLVKQLDLPLLIVARTGLGTLNHTLLTVYCARNMGIRVAGIFLNGLPAEPGPADRDAARQLSMTASADLLGVLPATAGDEKSRIEKLAVEIGSLQTRSWLMNAIGLPGINRGP